MTEQEKKEALKRWQEHCKRVERMTSQERVETEAERKRNMARALKDYAYFCQRYMSNYCECPNAKFHNEAARYIAAHPELRLVCKWPRGHAKSVHLDIGIPLWLKFRGTVCWETCRRNCNTTSTSSGTSGNNTTAACGRKANS